METIKSFTIDHDTHKQGFYLSSVNNNIYTYDLRFKLPNNEQNDYLQNSSMHTIEHLFATVIRNSTIKDKVVYFGPMGCRTGFYLLLLGIDKQEALAHIKENFAKCLELDTIPGNARKECGNYKEHSLDGAKKEITEYLKIISKG